MKRPEKQLSTSFTTNGKVATMEKERFGFAKHHTIGITTHNQERLTNTGFPTEESKVDDHIKYCSLRSSIERQATKVCGLEDTWGS